MHKPLIKILKPLVYLLFIALIIYAAPSAYKTIDAAGEIETQNQTPQIPSHHPSPGVIYNNHADIDPVETDIITGNEVNDPGKMLLSLDDINKQTAGYGSMTIAGMKPEDYDAAKALAWTALSTAGEPSPLSIDLNQLMDYASLENYIINLGNYEGVYVSVIGASEQGRNLYMVKVAAGGEEGKPVIMLTGSVHAREFAGAEYIIKFLNDTLNKALADPAVKSLLEKVVIVAVPLVNPDGREMILNGDNGYRKSNANGVDLNRAMPSVNAGQLAERVRRVKDFSPAPGLDFFAGYNLGTESETQALMKWLDLYVPKALVYIDLHQQGGVSLYNKPFISSGSNALSKDFARTVNRMLKYGYPPASEGRNYGINGGGGTLTDYACSIAEGFKYSYAYGRMVLDRDGVETPLVLFKDIDNCMQYYKPVNASFRVVTLEIGRKPSSLGAGARARMLRSREYDKYNWDAFLTGIINNTLSIQAE